MKKPETVTLTTFWLDWLLLPLMLALSWVTFRWALADYRLASSSPPVEMPLPPWVVAAPLAACALGWAILGFGSLIRQEYYEHRIWVAILVVWSLSCLIGVVLIGWSYLQAPRGGPGLPGALSLIGLLLTALMLSLPALMDVPLGSRAARFSRQWTVLLAISLACTTAGVRLGFPYNFARLPFAIAVLFFFGLGALEAASSTPTFPWLARLYDLDLEQEVFLAGLPKSSVWRIEGVVKLLVGIGATAMFIVWSVS